MFPRPACHRLRSCAALSSTLTATCSSRPFPPVGAANSWKSPAAKTLGKEVDALKQIQAQLAEQTRAAAAFAR